MIAGGLATLMVEDLGRAVRFYVETLGMKLVTLSGDAWAEIDAGAGLVLGLHAAPKDASKDAGPIKRGENVSVGLRVKVDIDDAVAVFENRGITFTRKDDAFVRLAHFADPDGNALYLYEETKR